MSRYPKEALVFEWRPNGILGCRVLVEALGFGIKDVLGIGPSHYPVHVIDDGGWNWFADPSELRPLTLAARQFLAAVAAVPVPWVRGKEAQP